MTICAVYLPTGSSTMVPCSRTCSHVCTPSSHRSVESSQSARTTRLYSCHDCVIAFAAKVKTSDRTSILPVLLEGDAGSGKTALVANLVRSMSESTKPNKTQREHPIAMSKPTFYTCTRTLSKCTQAIEESFPFTKFISPEKLVGLSEGQRVARIQQVLYLR